MVLNCIVFLFLVACAKAQFHQDTYHIIHDRIDLSEVNKTAVLNPVIYVFNVSNGKAQAINASAYFTPGVKKNILMNVAVFKFVSNKYRPFPVNITLDLCEEYASLAGKNTFGIQVAVDHSNFRGCPCPVGLYWLYNFILEEDKFPPHIPFGKYRLDIHIRIDDKTFLAAAHWFGSVVAKAKED